MYNQTWESIDKRPLPEWFKESCLGIMIHWGVYSVPGFCEYQKNAKIQNGSEWYLRRLKNPQYSVPQDKEMKTIQFHQQNYKNLDYYDFAEMFTADKWNPDEWAALFKKAGAKYVVITAKHHDGYTLFPHQTATYKLPKTHPKYPNKIMPWCATEIGPKRDIILELKTAVEKVGLRFGIYYSLLEWYPVCQKDFIEKVHMQIKYLVEVYRPSVLWFDGDWGKTDEEWKILELLAWLYNESPVKDYVVVNDRLGKHLAGKHGDFYNYSDRYMPNEKMNHKWESVQGITPGWGFNYLHTDIDFKSIGDIKYLYKKITQYGGNMLLNVGPDRFGQLPQQEINVLENMNLKKPHKGIVL